LTVLKEKEASLRLIHPFHCWGRKEASLTPVSLFGKKGGLPEEQRGLFYLRREASLRSKEACFILGKRAP